MITIIPSAKTLNINNKTEIRDYGIPIFLNEAFYLANELGKYSVEELSLLMNMSPKLSEINYERFKDFKLNYNEEGKSAIYAFNGELYKSMNVYNYNGDDINFLQKHLRIISGLYGILKPLDIIKEYRLEMGVKLITPKSKDLYEFWGIKITNNLKQELTKHKEKYILNLASEEYSKVIKKNLLKDIKFYNVTFKQKTGDTYKTISTYVKKARGVMVSYIIKNSIDDIEGIKGFKEDGYIYREDLSSDNNLVFIKE